MSRRLVITSASHATQGGVESIVRELCRELPARGWETTLWLAKGSRFNDVNRYREANADLPIVEIDGTKGTRQARAEALARLIHRHRPDVVLSFRVFDAYQAAAREKARHGSPRLAIAIRGYEAPYLVDAGLYRSNIDLCVVDGELLAAAAERLSGLPSKCIVSIPGGIRAPIVPAGLREPATPLRLGYVGRFAQADKRVLDVVELAGRLAAERVPFSLDLVGAGPEEEVLRARLAPFVQQGTVRFRGWLSTEQLYAQVYPELDCLVHFSPAEGVTISPREAMAHGVVPIVSDFVGRKAEHLLVHDENCLVFAVADIAAAVDHVRVLSGDAQRWKRLSAASRSSQRGKYSHEGALDLWARALDECMEAPPATGALPRLRGGDHGRLDRLGLSPWSAQRVRDLLRVRPLYDDPGSEWPTSSGLMTDAEARRIVQYAQEFESAHSR